MPSVNIDIKTIWLYNATMKSITVRSIPEDLYRAIYSLAKHNRRSIQQQILCLLYAAKDLGNSSVLQSASKMREKLKGRELGDSVAEIREDRER